MTFGFYKASANVNVTSPPSPLQLERGVRQDEVRCDSLLKPMMNDTLTLLTNQKESVLLSEVPKSDSERKKKRITAICAFPFPFGFVGAHRVMLGTKPWVPVVYVATFGGCFGLLPLIDFCVILWSKNTEQYENNPNIFMWMK